MKATFSLSERQRVVGGIVIPEGPFPADYDKTGQVTFDPSSLFISGTNWSNAVSLLTGLRVVNPQFSRSELGSYAKSYAKCFNSSGSEVFPDKQRSLLEESTMRDCIAVFGGSKRGGIGFLAAAIPNFTFKRASQFDFVKNAGILVPAPFGEAAVNSYTFTWDLTRVIAPSAARLAVVDAMTQASKVATAVEKNKPSSSRLCVIVAHNQQSLLPVPASFTEAACRQFAAKLDEDGQYALACVLSNDILMGDLNSVHGANVGEASHPCGW